MRPGRLDSHAHQLLRATRAGLPLPWRLAHDTDGGATTPALAMPLGLPFVNCDPAPGRGARAAGDVPCCNPGGPGRDG